MLRMEDKKMPWLLNAPQDQDFHDGYTPIRPRATSAPRMQPRPRSTIVITEGDEAKLRELLKQQGHRYDAALVRCLDVALSHAFVVTPHQVAPDVVTMNSRVLYQHQHNASPSVVRLVYSRRGSRANRVPVLSPVGVALLGARVGETAFWSLPDRQVQRLRVMGLPYQPERAGDFHL